MPASFWQSKGRLLGKRLDRAVAAAGAAWGAVVAMAAVVVVAVAAAVAMPGESKGTH
jgi:hypothetical protein